MRFMTGFVLFLCACGGGNRSFDLTVTLPDGSVSKHSLSDDSGFQFDGTGRATFSWPDVAEWNKEVPVGISMQLALLQAGRYATSGFLHLGDHTVALAKPLSLEVTVERVRWQGSGSAPFRWEGTATGTSTEGHKVEGRFSTTTDDCSDKVRANGSAWACGYPFPSDKYTKQTWSIANWVKDGDCPAGLIERFGGGTQLVIDAHSASAGGARDLGCVVTYANAYRVVCGANEENVQIDGCAWGVTALALPGIVSLNQPAVFIIAGTTGSSCAPRFCAASASGFTHVSGAAAGN